MFVWSTDSIVEDIWTEKVWQILRASLPVEPDDDKISKFSSSSGKVSANEIVGSRY